MAEIDDKVLKKIEKNLNTTISNLLYGGGGDPGWSELAGAAASFEVLKLLGLKVKSEKDIRQTLEGENVYDDNFIKGL
jgi:hypothetical protein